MNHNDYLLETLKRAHDDAKQLDEIYRATTRADTPNWLDLQIHSTGLLVKWAEAGILKAQPTLTHSIAPNGEVVENNQEE